MKVFLSLPTESRGVGRVHKALQDFAPSEIEFVTSENHADLVVIHVIGRLEHVTRQIERLKAQNKPYAMIQYCLRSTINPHTKDWLPLWNDAEMVWSYYDLPKLCDEDGELSKMGGVLHDLPYGNFYYAPLGVDSSVFKIQSWSRPFIVATCSQHFLAEGVKECWNAAQRINRPIFYLGNDLRRDGVVAETNISDSRLAYFYNQCEFVSGLRRIEGFELPVLEGLLCGARPVVYDQPHYRQWFGEFAIFIKERSREEVIEDLVQIFTQGSRPINIDEASLVKERFSWPAIIAGFWERILG